ncbi:Hypothetical protein SMAX5B_018770 [Scophthalmus maximus]|uniref:Uncharacterized protein n=1 Tax=Scophthalmus maximus TaxID=52904 RepID=A0A2U9BRA2_SCOMX|nr:Hypothetical protein SMAX5B_018770 [Scophthalmus maximus]
MALTRSNTNLDGKGRSGGDLGSRLVRAGGGLQVLRISRLEAEKHRHRRDPWRESQHVVTRSKGDIRTNYRFFHNMRDARTFGGASLYEEN